MFRTDLLPIIRGLLLYTQQYVFFHTGFADCLLARSGFSILISLADSQFNLYDIYLLLCIQY